MIHGSRWLVAAGLFSMSAMLFGCGESAEISGGSTGETPVEEVGEDIPVDTSMMMTTMSFDQELLKEELAANDNVLEIRPDFTFNAIRLNMFVQAFPSVEIAREGIDGRVSKFSALEFDVEDENGEILRELFFPAPMKAIWLRFEAREEFIGPQQADAIDYLDVRLYAEATPGEELPLHLDDFDEEVHAEEGEDPFADGYSLEETMFLTVSQGLHVSGRYMPPQDVINRANAQYVRYEGSPSRPSGGLLPGTRALGNYLKGRFPGIRSYGGYAARRKNVQGGSNQWSVHAAGRALDLMIPMSRSSVCGANNTVGDEVVRWLIHNAEYVGVTYLIWDQTSYGAGRGRGRKFRQYRGGNCTQKHADHIHVEISSAAANRRTPFFGNMNGGADVPSGGSSTPAGVSCSSATLGRRVDENTCVQQSSAKGCGWFKCSAYNSYTRLSNNSGCASDKTFGHQTCGAAPTPTPQPDFTCPSATLGRRVDENTCVQQSSARGCGWFKCTSPGSYSRLTDSSSCEMSATFSHATCPQPTASGGSRTNQLVITMEWNDRAVDLDLNVKEPSGRLISYSRSSRSPDDGNLSLCDPTNPRRACASLDTFTETIVWGEVSKAVKPGTYQISVRNFDEPKTASYTIKAELFDADGNVSSLGEFSGSSTTYEGMSVGQVVVP